jgi:hypothetical protein
MHAGDTTEVNPKTLDFPARSRFLVATGRDQRDRDEGNKASMRELLNVVQCSPDFVLDEIAAV